jgi:hypothetical protein
MRRICTLGVLLCSVFAAGAALAAVDPQSPTAGPSNPPPAAAAPADPAAAAPKAAKFDPNQVICHREEETGTRLGVKKICHTRQEWADMAAAARTQSDQIHNGSLLHGPQ